MFGSKKQVLVIEGMMCEHCAAHVTEALKKLDGVSDAKVDLKSKSATVKVKEAIGEDAYRNAIEEAGYKLIEVR